MSPRRNILTCCAFALACAGAGCSGRIGASTTDPQGQGGSDGTSNPQPDENGNLPYAAPTPAAAALPARVWRLTHLEYRKSVKALSGVDVDTADFEAEPDGGLFANISNVNFVRLSLATSYYDAAARVSDTVTEAQLKSLASPCGSLTTACKADFIRTVAARAYRRPATADDTSELGGIFDLAVPAGDPVLPFRSVLQAVLTSPYFLYRTEIGLLSAATSAPPAGGFRLTDHEVAALLSYSLLEQPPTAALLAAADRGELTKPATLRTTVDALLAASEAGEPLRAFLFQWLTLNRLNDDLFKFPDLFPGFDGVRAAMIDEANAFFAANGSMNGSVSRLLTAAVPPASGALATFYTGPGAGPGTRTGWLALGGFLAVAAHANQSSPTLRGHYVRERLLCQHLTIPPGVPVLEEVETMGGTPTSTRALYQMHAKPDCAVCHQALDQIGFTFESFDGAGRFRTEELFRNQPSPVAVDTSGSLVNTDVNRPLANQTELAQALAASAWVRECAAIQTFRYYFGFGDDVRRGLPPVMAGYTALTNGGGFRELIAAVMSSPTTYERAR